MRTHTKPIGALAAGVLLFSGVLGQKALAQEILNSSTSLTSSSGTTSVGVAYTVTKTANASSPTGDTYEYTYQVSNPTSGILESFQVPFDVTEGTIASGASVITSPSSTVSGGSSQVVSPGVAGSIEWIDIVTTGHNTGTLEFESDDAPVFVNANANGTTPGPWASTNPNGGQVPVPSTVPEPGTSSLLAAAGMMLLPFGRAFLKRFGS